jgi:hypothetical protein
VIVIRYMALASVIVWIAAMTATLVVRAPLAAAYASAVTLFLSLVALKFIGPPPPAFIPRAVMAFGMAAVTAFTQFIGGPSSTTSLVLTIGLGLALVFWYVRD